MAKLPTIKLELNTENIALGTVIRNLFSWETFGLLKYDKESETILLNEGMLLTIIKMVNPAQKDRKLKIVSQEDWIDKCE